MFMAISFFFTKSCTHISLASSFHTQRMEIVGTPQINTSHTGTLLTIAYHTFCFFAFFRDHTDVNHAGVWTDFCVARGVSCTEDVGPTAVGGGFECPSSPEYRVERVGEERE